MADTEKKLILSEWLLFLFLVLFPLGQLTKISLYFWGNEIRIHPIDVVAGFSIIFLFFHHSFQNKIYESFKNFLISCFFSLMLSLSFLPFKSVLIGSLFFLRIFAYVSWFLMTSHFILAKPKYKEILFKGLIIACLFVAISGWIQYLFMPDLRFLKAIGWDDHLNRLVGTFLDPGFTGIILVFGFLASMGNFLKNKTFSALLLPSLFLLSILFTYSRTSYLALISGFSAYAFILNKKKAIILLSFVFVVALLALPKPGGEGVNLERTFSIYAKLTNYRQTFTIVKEHPLFGVGFNNLCAARKELFNDIGLQSHSCSGSDSSLLLVVATTGLVGLMIFLDVLLKIPRGINDSIYAKTFTACFFALLVHSLFVNSLFYPWVMGWMLTLLAISHSIKE